MPGDPIGCYMPLLVFALVGLFALHVPLITLLTRLNLTTLLSGFNILFAALYGWLLSGLAVCLLLYLWLKSRRAAVVVTPILAILWVAGLTRYAQGENVLSPILVVVLTMGIPVLLVLWFLQPLQRLLAILLSCAWFLLWLLLIVGLQEYLAGVVLFLSLVASGAAFLPGLYIASGFLLPLPGKDHRNKVFNFLRDYMQHLNFPVYVVVDELREEDRVEERVPGNPFGRFTTGPGFILTDCDYAVAVSEGIRFKGVQGPGVIFTGFADQVAQTIDLRPQLRAFHVEALTKDGIKIRVLTFTPCKIDARGRQPRLGEPLPYNKSAAHKAFLAQRVEHEGKGQIPARMKQCTWDELSRMIAERILQNIISKYDFDDLYGPYQPGGEPPRTRIARIFCERLAAELEPLGIRLIGGGISDLEPADPQVYVKRARSWQAEWTRRITLRQAEGQAEWLRMVERARAEAQADLILRLGRQLEELSAERTELRPETALNLLVSILEGLMRQQPTLGQIVPGETLQALMGIREAITE
ncbi:MAG: hypothetical protein ACE5OS_09140 [Anaerolineae bacterium]